MISDPQRVKADLLATSGQPLKGLDADGERLDGRPADVLVQPKSVIHVRDVEAKVHFALRTPYSSYELKRHERREDILAQAGQRIDSSRSRSEGDLVDDDLIHPRVLVGFDRVLQLPGVPAITGSWVASSWARSRPRNPLPAYRRGRGPGPNARSPRGRVPPLRSAGRGPGSCAS